MKAIFSISLLVLLGLFLESRAVATPLTGTIRDGRRQPLAKVRVLSFAPLPDYARYRGTRQYEVLSDEKGFFRLPDHGQVIYFMHPELRPVTKILPLSARTVEVVMEEATASLWSVPQCRAESDKGRTGIAFKVLAPEGVLVRKGTRAGVDVYYYGYQRADGTMEVMVNWEDSTAAHPGEETMLEAKYFTERMWRSGQRFGYDVRGRRPDGKLWRFVSYRWGAITYQGNSPEAAKVFDRMMDGLCFDEEDARKYPAENF